MTTADPMADQPFSTGPQPGWYRDPAVADGSSVRWWTGAAWSEHTRPVVAAPPPVAAPSVSKTPAGAARPVTSAPRTAAAAPAVAQRAMHNGTAWLSFGLGLLAVTIVSLVFLGHRTSIWISSSGVVAIISGARALRLRSLGVASAVVPAVLGIVFGALGTLMMLAMILSR
jgi:hypothetical protein